MLQDGAAELVLFNNLGAYNRGDLIEFPFGSDLKNEDAPCLHLAGLPELNLFCEPLHFRSLKPSLNPRPRSLTIFNRIK